MRGRSTPSSSKHLEERMEAPEGAKRELHWSPGMGEHRDRDGMHPGDPGEEEAAPMGCPALAPSG